MDVKSDILNGPLIELVYVVQPPGFEDPIFSKHIYRLHEALYGLKQALHAWYGHLKDIIVDHGFNIWQNIFTLFSKIIDEELFVCQLYVNDNMFGSNNKAFRK